MNQYLAENKVSCLGRFEVLSLNLLKIAILYHMSNTPALSNCGSRLFELIIITPVMRGSRNFCQKGSNFDNVFLVDERRDDQNNT